jgi:hypothetical protein
MSSSVPSAKRVLIDANDDVLAAINTRLLVGR